MVPRSLLPNSDTFDSSSTPGTRPVSQKGVEVRWGGTHSFPDPPKSGRDVQTDTTSSRSLSVSSSGPPL